MRQTRISGHFIEYLTVHEKRDPSALVALFQNKIFLEKKRTE